MTNKVFEISVEELFPKFREHLEIKGINEKDNSRILFSGKFGIGKTYFLNKFFEANKENYEVFHFFPVNYQISANEDVIELIKYDILIELLNKDKNIFQGNNADGFIDQITLFYNFCKESFTINESLQSISSFLPGRLGRPLSDLLKFDEAFQKFKKEYKEGEKGIIDKYLTKIKDKLPNISETDYLSELLKQKIEKQKSGKHKQKKQSILILDDLERIDPEHIFRILNVFSAHFNSQNKELSNKFGFDKIILVADIQNLKSIFHHKYGELTDSSGYFDKFFSVEIFQFKNEEVIAKYVGEIISRFKIENIGNGEILKNTLERGGYLRIFLEDILLKSLDLDRGEEKLNLRNLLKGIKFQLPALKEKNCGKESLNSRDNGRSWAINIGIKVLNSIFSGINTDFVSVLERIKNNIKNKESKTECYDQFSYCLLNKIMSPFKIETPFGENENNQIPPWNKYFIEVKSQKVESVKRKVFNKQKKVSSYVKVDISQLFFDLLIAYVSGKFYDL